MKVKKAAPTKPSDAVLKPKKQSLKKTKQPSEVKIVVEKAAPKPAKGVLKPKKQSLKKNLVMAKSVTFKSSDVALKPKKSKKSLETSTVAEKATPLEPCDDVLKPKKQSLKKTKQPSEVNIVVEKAAPKPSDEVLKPKKQKLKKIEDALKLAVKTKKSAPTEPSDAAVKPKKSKKSSEISTVAEEAMPLEPSDDVLKPKKQSLKKTQKTAEIIAAKKLAKLKSSKAISDKLNRAPLVKRQKAKHQFDPLRLNRGVLLIKNLPKGFFEKELRQYFRQYGRITRLRLARSERTGGSKGHAYIEFKYPEVAKVAAEALNDYLMFRQRLKTVYIPPDQQDHDYFKQPVHFVRQKNGKQKLVTPTTIRAAKAVAQYNKKVTPEVHANRVERSKHKLSMIEKKLAKAGINIDLSGQLYNGPVGVKTEAKPETPAETEVEIKIKTKPKMKVGAKIKIGTKTKPAKTEVGKIKKKNVPAIKTKKEGKTKSKNKSK